LFLAALVFAGMLIPSRFAVTLTPSVDHRVFFLKYGPQENELKRGVYVLFDIRSEYIDRGKAHTTIKRIACTGGERLLIRGAASYCDGRAIAVAKERSLRGEMLPHFAYDGKIPEGALFVTGQHRDSFDSRYFGFVQAKEVKALAYPIF
jgi:signal peptidase I